MDTVPATHGQKNCFLFSHDKAKMYNSQATTEIVVVCIYKSDRISSLLLPIWCFLCCQIRLQWCKEISSWDFFLLFSQRKYLFMANIKETWRHTELPSHWGEGSLCSSISQPIRTQTSLIICKATSFLVALFFFLFSFSVKFHVVQCNMKDEIIISLESGWLCSSIYITISIPHNGHNAVSFHVQMFCIFKKKLSHFSFILVVYSNAWSFSNPERLFQLHTKTSVGSETT